MQKEEHAFPFQASTYAVRLGAELFPAVLQAVCCQNRVCVCVLTNLSILEYVFLGKLTVLTVINIALFMTISQTLHACQICLH